jgi:hypothetical protein
MSNQNPLDAEAAKGANYTEALNQLLNAVHCPPRFHPFLRTLIGYADGREYIEVYDAELGTRHQPGRSAEAAAKWVQRNRKHLNEWQDAHKLYLVETKSGTKDVNGNPIPSSYFSHLPLYINQVLEEAQKDQPRWDNHPHAAIEFAARQCVRNIFTNREVFGAPRTRTKGVDEIISQRLKLCITTIERVAALMEKRSELATKEQQELWQELKGNISFFNYLFEDEDEDTNREVGLGYVDELEDEDEQEEDDDTESREPNYDTE